MTVQVSLFPAALPFARPYIAGFPVGSRVAFGPPLRGLERHGRVIATLPHFNCVVVRTDDHAIVDIAPERCRRLES